MNRHVKQTCKEYRVIPIADLPKSRTYPENTEATATIQDLEQLGIFEFDRGSTNIQALCVGYYCPTRKCGVNNQGEPWPGTLIAGSKGIYRRDREPMIERSLRTYKKGKSGGKRRLIDTPLEIETKREVQTPEGETVVLEPVDLGDAAQSIRLKARLPKIMGDG